LTASSSARPAGLFHPARALGVRSSEPCSRSRAATPLGVRCPPDVRGGSLPRTRIGRTPASAPTTFAAFTGLACAPRARGAATTRLQGLVSLDRAVSRAPGIGRSRVTAALTSFLSPGASRPRLPRRLTARSSRALHGRPFRSSRCPGPKTRTIARSTRRGSAALRSLNQRGARAGLSRDWPPLLRSPTLSRHSIVREPLAPSSRFRSRATSPRSADLL